MAQTILIKHNGSEYNAGPVKVERSKIYGSTLVRAITPDGKICTQGGINHDGVTLVDTGCTKTGLLTADGRWMDRSELQAFNVDGTPAQIHPSTFEQGIVLTDKATAEDLLNLNVVAVYQLVGCELSKLAKTLGNDIFRCKFSYRGGYDVSDAFLLGSEGILFIISGKMSSYEPIGIDQEGVWENESEESFDEEELDFSMI